MHEGSATRGLAATAEYFDSVRVAFQPPTATVLLARVIGFAKVWVWAVPGMLILACVGGWRWRKEPGCRLLIASALTTLLGYVVVTFDQGHGWGYRYFHSAWIALPILAAGALRTFQDMPGADTPSARRELTALFTDAGSQQFVVACALLSLTAGVGFFALQMHEVVSMLTRQEPAYTATERTVVIIDPRPSFYGQDLVQNDPWLRGNVVRMITQGGAADADMMRTHFPGLHRIYVDRYGSVWSEAAPRVAATPP
jgi:hypothetical protein